MRLRFLFKLTPAFRKFNFSKVERAMISPNFLARLLFVRSLSFQPGFVCWGQMLCRDFLSFIGPRKSWNADGLLSLRKLLVRMYFIRLICLVCRIGCSGCFIIYLNSVDDPMLRKAGLHGSLNRDLMHFEHFFIQNWCTHDVTCNRFLN